MSTNAQPANDLPRPRKTGLLKKLRRIWAVAGTLALIGFFLYMPYSYQASGFAYDALRSDRGVRVDDLDDRWVFEPRTEQGQCGLIFLPGSLVDPVAYAPLLRRVAELGHRVILLRLPWRMFGPLAADQAVLETVRNLIRDGGPQRRWVVGGHSKGGALAADFASRFSAEISGLILIGTTHPRDSDLSRLALPTAKIYGSRDGLAPMEEVLRLAAKLPPNTQWFEIEGANHSQFGWYGFQLGDRSAWISRERQQAQLLEGVMSLLGAVDSAG